VFEATLGAHDRDLGVRWALTVAAIAAGATAGALIAIVAWLARITAELILRLLDQWLGLSLAPYLFAQVALVELDPPIPVDLAVSEELSSPPSDLAEPEDLLAGGAPAWRREPTIAPAQARIVARDLAAHAGLLALLGSGSDSGLSSLFGSGSLEFVAGGEASAFGIADSLAGSGVGGLRARGGGPGGGGEGTIGLGSRGSGQAGGRVMLGTGVAEGLGSLSARVREPVLADGPAGSPTAGGGATLSVDRRRRATIVDPSAGAEGASCTVTIEPVAPAESRVAIAGCPSAVHGAVRREVARRGWTGSPGEAIVRVIPTPPSD
jgi:hypothetical protein